MSNPSEEVMKLARELIVQTSNLVEEGWIDEAAEIIARALTGYTTVDPSEGEQAKPCYPDPVASDELRPCPFCGPGESHVDLWHDDVSHRWRVGCGRCGCSTGISPRDKTQAPAIAAWNRRYPDPVMDAVRRCAEIAREQAKAFLSPEYATGQPLSSLSERIACEIVAGVIEAEFGLLPTSET